jgi:chromate transporter
MSTTSEALTMEQAPPATVSLREAFRYWLKLGFISSGGPGGQISMMHTELVERRRWISEHRFLHALNYTVALPGPEARLLALPLCRHAESTEKIHHNSPENPIRRSPGERIF